jgi:hydrogenase maturation protease
LRVPPSDFTPVRCLILACGNTLRSDDGVGPWLASWAEERFAANPALRVVSRQQWTPDLAEELAYVDSVIFVDCTVDAAPGAVRITRVQPAHAQAGLATHHMGAAELLALCEELYASVPRNSLLLTIGAGSIEMGETFSKCVNEALQEACKILETAILRMLTEKP